VEDQNTGDEGWRQTQTTEENLFYLPLLLCLAKLIELRVEHPDDLRGLVADDLVGLLVKEHRHREPANIVWVGEEVQLLDV